MKLVVACLFELKIYYRVHCGTASESKKQYLFGVQNIHRCKIYFISYIPLFYVVNEQHCTLYRIAKHKYVYMVQ
jgi:hypothetical protein